jgi:DNA-binding NarL/FixJ family response regulator
MKILVVDDDPLVSRSLKVLLSRERDLEVIGTAGDGAGAIAACERSLPEAVLMDIRMPGMDGIEATRRIKERWPGVRVLILTTFQDDESIHRALQAGADGYLLKSTPTSGMAQRLRALGSGASVIDRTPRGSHAAGERRGGAGGSGVLQPRDRRAAHHQRGDGTQHPLGGAGQARPARPHPARDPVLEATIPGRDPLTSPCPGASLDGT